MLEIRKGTASKNYENTFFRELEEHKDLKKQYEKITLQLKQEIILKTFLKNILLTDFLLQTLNVKLKKDFK